LAQTVTIIECKEDPFSIGELFREILMDFPFGTSEEPLWTFRND
jgi:hypothetical protein